MQRGLVAATAAVLGALALSSAASAAVTVANREAGNLSGALLYGQTYIYDWDSIANSNFSFSADTATNYESPAVLDGNGYGTLIPGISAPPPIPYAPSGDYHYENTDYYTITSGGSATLSALGGAYLTSFSLYMGSPDLYNHVTFTFTGMNGAQTLSGPGIYTPPSGPAADGDQSVGFRVYYDFAGQNVKSVTFSSTPLSPGHVANSFEFDGLAATFAVVPEPATWAMMIGGFGMAGAMLRRRRTAIA
ncbi:PEPxxWA-CTERM sorting domain-containing protein [uncultured Phenylobacterium sp.]|uniref:PEPxxWA-CTERM sorting domain-containing protein n=1 Tax=uncultured Phenylobacterium sp. TaxID=349273 RepID=UPI0025E9B774|nr:PEPxxWA-CTERM sorting domain-containing protein [uncultured Phenylobacterium sp.]